MRNKKLDSWAVGVSAGLILPIVSILIYWRVAYSFMDFYAFKNFLVLGRIYTQVMSLCIVPNLGLFFLFLQFDFYNSARGVMLASIVYTILNFILKFI
jgi:hypothetical protein